MNFNFFQITLSHLVLAIFDVYSLLSPLYTSAVRCDAAQLNKIEIKEVVHCLYTYAAWQLAGRRGFFHLENFLIFRKTARLFHCFSPSFHRYWDFPHVSTPI